MEIAEIQAKLLENERLIDKLSRTIKSLPDCDARNNLQKQLDQSLTNYSILGNFKDTMAPKTCDYGFQEVCPKSLCRLCPSGKKIFM